MRPSANRAANNVDQGDGERERRTPSRDAPRRRRRESSPPLDDEGCNKRIRPIVLSSKKKTTDAYGTAARRLTRIGDMYWHPTSVINAGISLLSLDSEEAMELEMTTASAKKKALYETFLTLSDLIPGLQDSTDWDSVRAKLEHHKSAAKTEDNHTFKTSSPNWLVWDPPLCAKSKLGRGLNHPECAKLLCPIEVDWEDKTARNKFLVELSPPMTAGNWPAFLYEDYKADLDDLSKGFMRSDIMVRAAREVLFPSSIAGAKEGPDHQSNRRSKAEIYEMEGVTVGFLAYVAVEVRYTLSSETSFNCRGGIFNYQRFYTDLVAHLNDPVCKPDKDELFKWWDELLFPPKPAVEDDEESNIVVRMRRQREAKQHLLQEGSADLE